MRVWIADIAGGHVLTGCKDFRCRWYAGAAAAAIALGGAQLAQAQEAPKEAPHFDVRAIQVIDNKLLPPAEVEAIVYPFMGPNRTADDIEAARAALQKAYETRGYVTVAVNIPEQSVESGIIRLQVESQVVGAVTVKGGRQSDRILARAPSLAPGAVPDFNAVQRDIVLLNRTQDRRVTPEVTAGAAPGTIDVNLAVEEHSPLHGSAEISNYSSAQTSDLRVAGTLHYDNLWGRGDSLSISSQFAPRRPSDGTVLSANYLARLGAAQALAYYVHSDSDIAIIGGVSVIGKGDMAGVRLILPLSQKPDFYQSVTLGFDYKSFQENVRLGADQSSAPIRYAPVTVGWRGDWSGDPVTGNLSLSGTWGIRGIGDDAFGFATKRYKASPSFFYLRGEAGATVDFWHGAQVHGRLAGQYTDGPLVSNEQFSIGGSESVRGYFESETLADYGLAYQFELRSPELLKRWKWMNSLRLLGFVDSGLGAIHDPLIGQDASFRLASTGLGLRLNAFRYFNAALDAGVPLIDGPDTEAGRIFARFRFWGEF
jgi:hemolysin activation/secretion protein